MAIFQICKISPESTKFHFMELTMIFKLIFFEKKQQQKKQTKKLVAFRLRCIYFA